MGQTFKPLYGFMVNRGYNFNWQQTRKIIIVDNSFKEECIMMIVHVIVGIDISIGIFEIIYIIYGDKSYTQVLDYSNVSF